MTPVEWATRPQKKYAEFSGRAPRAEYWWYVLGLIVAAIVISIIEGIAGVNTMVAGIYGPLTVLLWIGTLVPSIAVAVRRLHDTNRPGWWLLAYFIPYAIGFAMMGPAILNPGNGGAMASFGLGMIFFLIGFIMAIVILVFTIQEGTKGTNKYGDDPYGADMEKVFA
jgi:uncharacterized membrane protein YhaH (DUF805 family)